MFIILSYDVKAKRVAKVKKTCSKYLVWVQNSVFEGNITDSKLKRLKKELSKLVDTGDDNIRIYRLENIKYSSVEILGKAIDTECII